MSFYPPILFEAAWTASVIPFSHEPTLFAMKAFGGFDMKLACALAVIGATVGQMANWWIGDRLLSLRVLGKFNVSDYWYNRISTFFNKYGVFLLLFSWVPLCNFLVAIAGFVGAKPRLVLQLVFVGQLFNYGRYLL